MDSRFETSTTLPPAINDTFRLVSSYWPGSPFPPYPPKWDDHDPKNVLYLIDHLAYLMDTDGRRTQHPATAHTGTFVWDMEAGIAQYLSWRGVNPRGDVNGDGIVNMTDYNIVLAANGTTPGQPGWNMAADIWPSTNTIWLPPYPTADNKVDNNDLNWVLQHMNRTGMFYEQTIAAPTFEFIEEEVMRSEDVILVLGFYQKSPVTDEWYRVDDPYEYGSGHAVTVAGVNSTALQIGISDPIQDNAEPPPQGTNGLGRVLPPPPHPHAAGPPYSLHNNATYVSHDIYNVNLTLPPISTTISRQLFAHKLFKPAISGNARRSGVGNHNFTHRIRAPRSQRCSRHRCRAS
jgi:hypothetical protein